MLSHPVPQCKGFIRNGVGRMYLIVWGMYVLRKWVGCMYLIVWGMYLIVWDVCT